MATASLCGRRVRFGWAGARPTRPTNPRFGVLTKGKTACHQVILSKRGVFGNFLAQYCDFLGRPWRSESWRVKERKPASPGTSWMRMDLKERLWYYAKVPRSRNIPVFGKSPILVFGTNTYFALKIESEAPAAFLPCQPTPHTCHPAWHTWVSSTKKLWKIRKVNDSPYRPKQPIHGVGTALSRLKLQKDISTGHIKLHRFH